MYFCIYLEIISNVVNINIYIMQKKKNNNWFKCHISSPLIHIYNLV